MAGPLAGLGRWLLAPLLDAYRGLERVLEPPAEATPQAGFGRLAAILVGLLAGWWLYVPVHELLHAAGCLITGGEVSRLEISPLYLGDLWSRAAPWIESGGEYAGRLAGFDTHGDDLVYFATVFAPYLLTVFPGVWAMRAAARRGSATLFGLSLPIALAPLVSALGDAYEIGSIAVTRVPPWTGTRVRELVRGDDLFVVLERLANEAGAASLLTAAAFGLAVGLLWAVATWAAGGLVASRLGQRPLAPLKRAATTADRTANAGPRQSAAD